MLTTLIEHDGGAVARLWIDKKTVILRLTIVDAQSYLHFKGSATHLMPDPKSASDEAIVLEQFLQRQLEEDIARIFDESIYSDFEVVCGKSKILTHSCILKARTNQFYHKLKSILHVNIDRNIFDEIYSYISDAYTECDIKNQEAEILAFLKLKVKICNAETISKGKETVDADVFATPKCTTPYENKLDQNLCTTPGKEIPKEYYALVPIDAYLLEKELNEQDELSNAFQSMNRAQGKEFKKLANNRKQLSLSLSSSHTLDGNIIESQKSDTKVYNKLNKHYDASELIGFNTSQKFNGDFCDLTDKHFEPTYSPDSLIADDPSSSSDYLSATHTCSPGFLPTSGCFPLNVGEHITKMENVFTSSDSGFENTGMLESLNSNKDITLTDLSLIETSQTHDTSSNFVNEPSWSLDPAEEHGVYKNNFRKNCNDLSFNKSSKDEKQRLNEEIVILESSSVSSETGSWESVFPPKTAHKDMCEKFISNERMYANQSDVKVKQPLPIHESEKSIIKPSSCFIDASALVDEENVAENLNIKLLSKDIPRTSFSTGNRDISPCDLSESCENDDSLEQGNNKDAEDTQKDLSPTMFEITISSDDLLHDTQDEVNSVTKYEEYSNSGMSSLVTVTPKNSILSLKSSSLSTYESDERINETLQNKECATVKKSRFNESSPIVSGGASVVDSLKSERHTGSPLGRRKIDNIPIVTGVSVEDDKEPYTTPPKSVKPPPLPAWVIDMSSCSKSEDYGTSSTNTNSDVQSQIKNGSSSESGRKSRSSVDSDGSEKHSHTYYIDLSIPDESSQEETHNEVVANKKNIFSMYIDLDNTPPKTKPRRLITHNKRKNNSDTKDIATLNTSDKSSKNAVSNQISINNSKAVKNAFETYETLCNDLNLSINEIISIPHNLNDSTIEEISEATEEKNVPTRSTEPSTIQEVIEESDVFVKLSDLDKPIQKSDSSCQIEGKNIFDDRMSRSIPENNWGDINPRPSRSSDIVNSFHSENALSLNRLFPHLKNEFSKSMPLSFSGKNQFRSGAISTNGETEGINSDESEISSVQSSMLCSVIENSTTEDTSQSTNIIGNSQSRLGQDLLRMFLEEIATDVVIEVSGRRINAHKCILSSRCQYFAGILSGGWVESAGNVIVLPPFSFNVVHFALCHIYSGMATIPDPVSIVELSTLSDMLGLDGLKDAIMFTLKSKYCHHFHPPCEVCVAGVLECFPLSSVYGLDDLYQKCLRWITTYFVTVWPTKAFATLPKELLEKCYQEHLVNLKIETVVDTMYGCGNVFASLQDTRWAATVQSLCRKLVNSTAHVVAKYLLATLKIVATITSDATDSEKNTLCDCISAAIEWASPEETCRAYVFLSNIAKEIKDLDNLSYHPENIDGMTITPNHLIYAYGSMWYIQCERSLVRATPRVVGTQAFKELPPDQRKRLRELGCIMYGPNAILLTHYSEKKSSRSPHSRQSMSASRIHDMEKVRNSFVPYKSKPFPVIASLDDSKPDDTASKKFIKKVPPKVKTTKAQEERAKYNQCKQQVSLSGKQVKAVNMYQNAKPRYLEPKVIKEKIASNEIIEISSSESSRNSSPIKSGITVKHLARRQMCMNSHDNIASSRPRTAEPSTESLSESVTSNKYATYTKTKHIDGSTEGITQKCSQLKSCSKSKIPVYTKKNSLPESGKIKIIKGKKPKSPSVAANAAPKGQLGICETELKKSFPSTSKTSIATRTRSKNAENPASNRVNPSLMNATKASSAKMVCKPVKPSKAQKSPVQLNSPRRIQQRPYIRENSCPKNALERSNTFSKDDAKFADKSHDIYEWKE